MAEIVFALIAVASFIAAFLNMRSARFWRQYSRELEERSDWWRDNTFQQIEAHRQTIRVADAIISKKPKLKDTEPN